MFFRSIPVFLFLLSATVATAVDVVEPPELVVYTYDTLLSRDGLGPAIFPLFEKRNHCRIRALAWGDGGQITTRLEVDARRKKPTAHVVLGIDQQTWGLAKSYLERWPRWTPSGYSEILPHLKMGEGFLPYDYSELSLIADGKALKGQQPPHSLKELNDPRWRRNLILEDPRTSTPGLSFLLFTESVLGKTFPSYWSQLKGQWLTLAPGWNSAYQLFLKGEAPLVWSYVTSQAYHQEHSAAGEESRYRAALFDEGQPIQIEGAAIVKGSVNSPAELQLARKFLEFLISEEVQTLLPQKNWMLPARGGVKLPPSFEQLPRSRHELIGQTAPERVKEILRDWNRALVGSAP